MQWCRLYKDFSTDPKVQSLSECAQRRFIMLLCFRIDDELSKMTDDDIAFMMRISAQEWLETKDIFISKGLINNDCEIGGWDKRQYSSTSAERMRILRSKRKNVTDVTGCDVTVTSHVTGCDNGVTSRCHPDTDTDTDIIVSTNVLTLQPKVEKEKIPYQKIVNLYHKLLPDLPTINKLTTKRLKLLRARWLNDFKSLEEWEGYFGNVALQPFLLGRGKNNSTWAANFDWLLNESNAQKVMEGNYVNS